MRPLVTQIDQSCAKEEEEDQKQRIRHVNCENERSKVKTESNVVRCFLFSSCSVRRPQRDIGRVSACWIKSRLSKLLITWAAEWTLEGLKKDSWYLIVVQTEPRVFSFSFYKKKANICSRSIQKLISEIYKRARIRTKTCWIIMRRLMLLTLEEVQDELKWNQLNRQTTANWFRLIRIYNSWRVTFQVLIIEAGFGIVDFWPWNSLVRFGFCFGCSYRSNVSRRAESCLDSSTAASLEIFTKYSNCSTHTGDKWQGSWMKLEAPDTSFSLEMSFSCWRGCLWRNLNASVS